MFNFFRGKEKKLFFLIRLSICRSYMFNSTWNATSRWDKPTAAEQKSASCDMWCSKPKTINRLQISRLTRTTNLWHEMLNIHSKCHKMINTESIRCTELFLSVENDDYHHGYESADVALLQDHPSQQEKWAFIQRSKVGLINACSKSNTISTHNIAAATIKIKSWQTSAIFMCSDTGGSCTPEYFWII